MFLFSWLLFVVCSSDVSVLMPVGDVAINDLVLTELSMLKCYSLYVQLLPLGRSFCTSLNTALRNSFAPSGSLLPAAKLP